MKRVLVKGFIRNRCSRCGGNIYLDVDYYGWYETCLQCGYSRDLETIVEVPGKVGKSNPFGKLREVPEQEQKEVLQMAKKKPKPKPDKK